MTTEQELRSWADKWLGNREIPEEFLQLTALQNAGLSGGEELSAIEAARPGRPGEDKGEVDACMGHREDRTELLEFLGVRIVGPRQAAFLARSVLDDEKNAEAPHFAEVLSHFLPVAETDDSVLVYGYWLHPGESWPPPVICVDDEGSFSQPKGRNIVESLLCRRSDGAQGGDKFSFFAQWFRNLGFTVTAHTAADVHKRSLLKDPEDLEAEIFGRSMQKSAG
ncbi:hypothetical protein ACH5AO_34810 [Streptomyces sp. NPDC018964]|uniref:hypothetical protein n=1 Tax=unclassified Streptomyces TaxID=2593676 RepID=UPI0037A7761F